MSLRGMVKISITYHTITQGKAMSLPPVVKEAKEVGELLKDKSKMPTEIIIERELAEKIVKMRSINGWLWGIAIGALATAIWAGVCIATGFLAPVGAGAGVIATTTAATILGGAFISRNGSRGNGCIEYCSRG